MKPKLRLLVAIACSVLFLSCIAFSQVQTASANFVPSILPPQITVQSPENDTEYPLTAPLRFTVTHPRIDKEQEVNVFSIGYSLNNELYDLSYLIPTISNKTISPDGQTVTVNFNHTINVNEDAHGASLIGQNRVLVVRVTISSGEWLSYTNQPGGFGDTRKASASSSEIKFTVDNIPPSVLLLSPKNQTYNTAVIPLDFTSNETLSEANYILDGQTSSPINGNTTLQNIAEGQHSLYLRIVDAAGNTKLIEKVQFTVADLPKPTPITQTPNATDSSNGQLTPTNSAVAPQSGTADQLPSGTLWVIVGAVVVIVVVATALVYLRKRGLKA